jgi:hypothetical protein
VGEGTGPLMAGSGLANCMRATPVRVGFVGVCAGTDDAGDAGSDALLVDGNPRSGRRVQRR